MDDNRNHTTREHTVSTKRLIPILALLLVAAEGRGEAQGVGFQLNRYEPTPVGDWFFSVEHPWYSSTRYFAAGVTMNYAMNPLVYGRGNSAGDFSRTDALIGHQLLGHVDLAGSFLDRVTIAASLPITLFEDGNKLSGIDVAPAGVGVGDPRLGFRVRLFGQPEKSGFSMSIGAHFWIPIGVEKEHAGDSGFRALPRLIMGGVAGDVFRWSLNLGFLYRPDAVLSSLVRPEGASVGSELQAGFAFGFTNSRRTFNVGPEATFATTVTGGHIFSQDYTSLELLLGGQFMIADQVMIGLGVGTGLMREPGTPDLRGLLRVAYAPQRRPPPPRVDSDGDGIYDGDDACPSEKGVASSDSSLNGCPPPPDTDGDGVIDRDDRCPKEPKGEHPDPSRKGCPDRDSDGDGVYDGEDRCVAEPMGERPDPQRKGCPIADKDGDGVLDGEDLCPEQAMGEHPDPTRKGCPAGDKDRDGVWDHEDKCPDLAKGMNPDPDKLGCPLPDRDGDSVPDGVDACPDKPGAPDPNPKKNGCPGLVEVKQQQIVILQQVYFATDKDVILKKSFPVLEAVKKVLLATPAIKKVEIQGHTDNQGKPEYNQDLSQRRAASVLKFLVDKGIAADRLTSRGYGQDKPIADNGTDAGRAKNRRVVFEIIDPPQPAAAEQR